MRRPSRTDLSWVLIFAISPLTAQNLDGIGREKPLSFGGGVSLNQILYIAASRSPARDPYSFFAAGNAHVALYGWNIPLRFSLSNRRSDFLQPFNHFVMHPKWKWISAHIGNTSMSFSPYTVNGHTFRGVGIDLTPGERWRFSALRGRFLKAAGGAPERGLLPVFQRYGYALKAGYHRAGNGVEILFFHASDDEHSLEVPGDSLGVTPQENAVASIRGSKTLFRYLILRGEVATSLLTRDTGGAPADRDYLITAILPIVSANASTSVHNAVKVSLQYRKDNWTAGFGYEAIDPGYRTFGTYYFNDDLKNITVDGSAKLADNKLSVTANVGVQRDNLAGTRVSTMRRLVNACNVHYTPSQRLNASMSWSTFRTFTNIRPQFAAITPFDNPDTLNFAQISRSASLAVATGNSATPGNSKSNTLALNISWQESADTRGTTSDMETTAFYNLNASYTVALLPQRASLSLSFNASRHTGAFLNRSALGPTAAVSWLLLNTRLRTSGSTSWNRDSHAGHFVTARLNSALGINTRHRITLNTAFISRHPSGRHPPTHEVTITLAYHWSLVGNPGFQALLRNPKL